MPRGRSSDGCLPLPIQAGQATIDLQGLPKGVYYVTLNDGKKQTTKKLLVL